MESRLGTLETQIRDVNGKRLLLLQRQAASAEESATRAADAAGRAEAIANRLSDRTSVLERGEEDVKIDLLLKGSRAELLGKPKVFVKLEEALKPIAGQKVDVRYPSDKEEGEALQTAEELAAMMRQAGVAATLPMLATSGRITGVVVYVTMRASATTRDNALILANALLDVPLVLRRNRSIPNPPPFGATYDSVLAREPQKFRPGVEPPPFDDETIVVLVAPHP